MKYFTKEWYELCQKTDYHFDLRADKRAEVLSEDYLKKLYAKAEAEHVAFEEAVCNVSFEDIYPQEFDYEGLDVECYTPEELAALEAEYYEMRDAAKDSFEADTRVFNEASAKRTFRSMWKDNIKKYEAEMPREILDRVADIRVLALGRASAEVKRAITEFCKGNERSIKRTISDYEKYYKKAFAKGKPHFAEGFDLHDCNVVSCKKSGKNIVMRLDNSGGFTDTSRVVFRNAEIICQDAPMRGAWWLYDEIYRTDGGYEIHALVQKKELAYFTVNCKDVEVYCD